MLANIEHNNKCKFERLKQISKAITALPGLMCSQICAVSVV